jgi:hypothetical protein
VDLSLIHTRKLYGSIVDYGQIDERLDGSHLNEIVRGLLAITSAMACGLILGFEIAIRHGFVTTLRRKLRWSIVDNR